MKMRLDKYLAEMGVGTRQEVKKYIRKGRVTVDGRQKKRRNARWIPSRKSAWTVRKCPMRQ